MKVVTGDLIQLALDGQFDVIVHGCNCFNTMGSGIAKSIMNRFPEAYDADQRTIRGDANKLGTYTHAIVSNNSSASFIIINAYTQYRYGTDKRYLDYGALNDVFEKIKKDFSGKRIGYPAIGAGLAGGNINIITKIIDECLIGEDHTMVLLP